MAGLSGLGKLFSKHKNGVIAGKNGKPNTAKPGYALNDAKDAAIKKEGFGNKILRNPGKTALIGGGAVAAGFAGASLLGGSSSSTDTSSSTTSSGSSGGYSSGGYGSGGYGGGYGGGYY